MKLFISILILAVIFISGCTQTEPITIPQTRYVCPDGSIVNDASMCQKPVEETKPVEINATGLEKSIFDFVNYERIGKNITPLLYSNKLAQIARDHSKDMILKDYCGHDTPEGETSKDRIKNGQIFFLMSGENIHCIWNIKNDTNLAETIVHDWMNSPGHRAAILTKEYSKAGVGVYCSKYNCSTTIEFIDDSNEFNVSLDYPYISFVNLFDPNLDLLIDNINASIFVNSTIPVNIYIIPNKNVYDTQSYGTNYISRWFVQTNLEINSLNIKENYGIVLENLNPLKRADIIIKVNYENP